MERYKITSVIIQFIYISNGFMSLRYVAGMNLGFLGSDTSIFWEFKEKEQKFMNIK